MAYGRTRSLGHYTALLPTGKRIDPRAPQKAEYYDKDQTLVIWKLDDGKLVGATSFGSGEELGHRAVIRHDQTLKTLSYNAEVVGTYTFATGEKKGEIPQKSIPHWVYK